MRKFLSAVVWVSVCALGAACNSPRAERAARPATTHLSQPFAIDTRQTLAFLASDELEGRGIGTKGLDRAANLIADDFAKMGLKTLPGLDGYFQPFEMTTAREVGEKTTLAVGDRKFSLRDEFSPVSFSGEGKFSGPVVFVGYGMQNVAKKYDDFAGIDVKGKVVLAMRYEPHDAKGNSQFEKDGWSTAAGLGAKANAASDAGAVALLLVTPPTYHAGDDQLVPFARWPLTEKPALPVIHIRQNVALELLKRGGGPELKALQEKIDSTGKPASFALADVIATGNVELVRTKATVKNVVAYLPGKIADEYVVVGAHYDHLGHGGSSSMNQKSREIHNGADDNASGTTAMLELASRFAAAGTPARSMIFVAFTAEEEGLIGSAHFVAHPPIALDKITAMINLDMVGRLRSTPAGTNIGAPPTTLAATTLPTSAGTTQSGSGILYVGGSGTAANFDAIVRKADQHSPLVIKDIGKGGLGPSDHMSFALKEIPVMFFFTGLHADYHRPTDDADKINYEGLEEVVDLVQDVIGQVVQSPRQAYVKAADAHSAHVGSPSSGTTVTLGVVPDYTAAMDAGGGVKISGTSPESPAAKAGLKAGDTIVKWNEKTIDTLYDLSDMLAHGKAGQVVKLKIMRDGKPLEVEATLKARG